ncbi:MAG: hypothetical protein HY875_17015 [Chloroflexi bacterium]|nr:hypothetical protein [Chloroflexota bacterium]
MAIFWEWGIRNLFAVAGALAAVAGLTAVLPWGLAFTALTVCCLFVRVGNTFMVQAQRRELEAFRREQARLALTKRLLKESPTEPRAKAA